MNVIKSELVKIVPINKINWFQSMICKLIKVEPKKNVYVQHKIYLSRTDKLNIGDYVSCECPGIVYVVLHRDNQENSYMIESVYAREKEYVNPPIIVTPTYTHPSEKY